jgi:uncharacterized protein YbjT (DUF2867 family)
MIIVTAPTGQIGHHVVRHLLGKGKPVRLIVRNAAKLPEEVRSQADVIEGSHGDAEVIARAFDGAKALFWVAPPDPTKTMADVYDAFTRPAAAALAGSSIRRVVAVTALGRGTAWQDRAGLVTASIGMDDMLMASGVAFRGLAMPSFMDNVLRQAPNIRDKNLFFGPSDPDRKVPTTATRDMGTVAARLLADESWSGQEEMPVLGPEDLSYSDKAEIMSDVLGRTIRYQQVSYDAFKAQLIEHGTTESFAQGYVDMFRAKDEGMDNVAERTQATRTPTTFRQWCKEELKPAVQADAA